LLNRTKWARKEVSLDQLKEAYQIFKVKGLSEAGRSLGFGPGSIKKRFISLGWNVEQETVYTMRDYKTGKLYCHLIKEMVESGDSQSIAQAGKSLGLTKSQTNKIIQRFTQEGGTINYTPKLQRKKE
jgi:hypothetical protein